MRLFGKQKRELPPLISDEELFPAVNYESVLDWLVGLSAKEYSQVLEVGNIHRDALERSAKVLGKPNEPTTFIADPKDELQTMPSLIIDKDPSFLIEDEKPKTKIKVKG